MPMLGEEAAAGHAERATDVRNPADHRDVVGQVIEARTAEADAALLVAPNTAPIWQSTPVAERAQCLPRAAQLREEGMPPRLGLHVQPAGKALPRANPEARGAGGSGRAAGR